MPNRPIGAAKCRPWSSLTAWISPRRYNYSKAYPTWRGAGYCLLDYRWSGKWRVDLLSQPISAARHRTLWDAGLRVSRLSAGNRYQTHRCHGDQPRRYAPRASTGDAPAERYEILVNFSDCRSVDLLTASDVNG